MKKVLVHGYFRKNLGDDLFFRVLAMRYPDVKFYLPTIRCDYKELFQDLRNVKIIDFLKVVKLTNRKIYMLPKIYSRLNMKRFDAVVCIGGSLFIDRMNPTPKDRIETENYSFICDWEYAKASNVPYFVLGANWGPCYNQYFYDYFNKAFDSLADLYFRDKASFHVFAGKNSVRSGGDILMGNPVLRNTVKGAEKKRQIAVSVVNPQEKKDSFFDAERYYQAIGLVCREYVSAGYDVKLLSFCKDEGDEEACEHVLRYIDNTGGIETVFYRGDWKEVMQVIARSELLIATRFHATVIGWTLGVPVYSIAYSNKTVNLMEDCGTNDNYIRMEDINMLTADMIKKCAVLPDDIDCYSGAEDAFVRLDKFLK